MKALLTLQLCGLALLGLLTSACTLLPLSPSLSLSVQAVYSSSTVSIPYSFQTLTQNSDGSARCSYSLLKYDPSIGGYRGVGGSSDTTLQSKGTLSFPLTTMLNTSAGSTAIDGLYELSFSVLSDNYDQQGNRIPFSFLTQTKGFAVHTGTGPAIFQTSPAIINPNYPKTITFTGIGFTSGGTLIVPPATPVVAAGYTYLDSQHISAHFDAGGFTPGTTINVQFTDSQGTTSPSYYLPVVGPVSVSGVSPASGSNLSSDFKLTVAGSYLGYWSTVTITDGGGHTATLQIHQVGSASGTTYLQGTINLTTLTTLGAATVTVSNPDGSAPATASFTVTS